MSQEKTPELKRTHAGKGPMNVYTQRLSPEYFEEEDLDEPSENEEETDADLAAFFQAHSVPLEARVKVCRSYASYLTSFLPKKKRARASPKE